MRAAKTGLMILLAALFLWPAVAGGVSPVPANPHLEKPPHPPLVFQVPTISFHGVPLPLEFDVPSISFHGVNLPIEFNIPQIAFTGEVDLVISGFEGKLIKPGQEDYSGLTTNYRRVQLHWTVKNIGDAPSDATVLTVRGIADGNAPLPSPPWIPDVNLMRRDFPVPILDPTIHQETHEVYTVFAVPEGSVKFRFNAHVNPDHTVTESNYANNGRLSTFAPSFTGMPPVHVKSPIHFIAPLKGISFSTGQMFNISWMNPKVKEKRIRLVLKQNQLRIMNITPPSGTINRGHYRWKIPSGIKPGKYTIIMKDMKGKTLGTLPIKIANLRNIQVNLKKGITGPPSSTTPLSAKPTIKPGTAAKTVRLKFLRLTSPRGMETWYIGETHAITWRASGIEGRIRIVLEDRHGKKQTLNGLVGTDVTKGHFNWKIGGNIKPGSMYKIYLKTPDGMVKSHKSGGFNIKMKLKKPPKNLLRN